jgi:hypothetical protein
LKKDKEVKREVDAANNLIKLRGKRGQDEDEDGEGDGAAQLRQAEERTKARAPPLTPQPRPIRSKRQSSARQESKANAPGNRGVLFIDVNRFAQSARGSRVRRAKGETQ